MDASTKNMATRIDVAALLSSKNPSENCKGIGIIMSGDANASDHKDALIALESSTLKAPLHMTIGELASILLDVSGIKKYQGDHERVRHYIGQLTA